MGFSHARARLFTASRNAHSAKTSVSKPNTRLVVYERASSIFPHRAPDAAKNFREFTTRGSDVELEAMESEQTGFTLSLPLSPEYMCVNSPVEFAQEYLCPSTKACNTVSFGLDDVLFTAASLHLTLGNVGLL